MGDIDKKAELLIKKIKHYLINNLGKVEKDASSLEFYTAFCYALREEITKNWIATEKSIKEQKAKTLYYLSMEYLPGKFIKNNITNLNAHDLVTLVLKKCERHFQDLVEHDQDPGLGNGGLGRLSSCFLDSLATQQYPAMGYGLRYQYGIFEQELWDGRQIERPDCWLLNHFPWEFRIDAQANSVFFKGKMIKATNSHGDEIFQLEDAEEIRALPYDIPIIGYSEKNHFSVLNLRLWSTKESPKNFELQRYNAGQLGEAGENTSLTDVLYPNDNNEIGKRIRLKQEFLLVCASLQDIFRRYKNTYEDLSLFAEKVQIQINDTHPALVVAELMRRLVKNYDIPWKKAWEITKNCCNYTNHTTLKEALEEWNEKRIEELLPRQHKIIQKINQELCNQVKETHPDLVEKISLFEGDQIKMSHLAIYGSKKINSVSKIHLEMLQKTIFKEFFEIFPDKFTFITNGITPRRWLLNCNPDLANLITKKIGRKWITNSDTLKNLHDFAGDLNTQKEFLEIKKQNKLKLIDFLSKKNPLRNYKGKIIGHSPVLDETALFDVQIKRFHEYKRQLLNALHLLILYDELKQNPSSRKIKRMAIIAGKSAPGYMLAKNIILLFFCIARKINNDPDISSKLKISFVENYDVSKAEIIIPAADLSEQISAAGLEASGTGNMKLTLNGALTIGTEDGANIEMKEEIQGKWWPFSFGLSAEEIQKYKKERSYKAWEAYTQNPSIKKAVDCLKNGFLVKTNEEHTALLSIYDSLLGQKDFSDPYFVLKDLQAYYETQKKVEELFSTPEKWAEFALHNIAGMGNFSSDSVVQQYAEKIWDLKRCPIDENVFKLVQEEYFENIH